jgi:hypothetical protein
VNNINSPLDLKIKKIFKNKKNLILKYIIVLFLFVSIFYSQQMIKELVPQHYQLAVIGIMISVILISLSYMAGAIFNLPTLNAFSKDELNNLIITILIVFLIFIGINVYREFLASLLYQNLINPPANLQKHIVGMCEDSKPIYGNSKEGIFFANLDWFLGCFPKIGPEVNINKQKLDRQTTTSELIKEYFNDQLDDKSSQAPYGIMFSYLLDMYISLLAFEMIIGPVSTLGFNVYIPEAVIVSINIGLAPLAGLGVISEALIFLSNMVGLAMITVIAQKFLLQFIYISVLNFLLPLGVMFRCLPFLRKTGSSIIALAIVAYFIYPITIWINEQIYLNAFFDNKGNLTLQKWANYETLLGNCLPTKEGETYEEYKKRAEDYFKKIKEGYKEIEFDQKKVLGGDPRFPLSHQHGIVLRATKELGKNALNVLDYFFGFSTLTNISEGALAVIKFIVNAFTVPFRTEYFYYILADQYITAGQWIVINLMFLVNSIVFTITIYKSISEALGGEAKMFGISRLL